MIYFVWYKKRYRLTDGRTDGRTTYSDNTALCTMYMTQ